jgi:hypothetical protein
VTRATATVGLALVSQSVYLIALAATDGYDAARHGELLRIVATFATVSAVFVFVSLTAPRKGRLGVAITFAALAAFVLLSFARYQTAGSFDFAFAYYNVRELATPLGRRIVGSHVRVHEIVLLLAAPLVGAGYAARAQAARWPRRARRAAIAVCAVVLVTLPVLHVSTHDTLTSFVASAIRFWGESREADASEAQTPWPLVHDFTPSDRARAIAGESKKPHVILLFLESWSELYTDRGFTPVFDAHRKTGLTLDHFYGNSVQSSRGRYSTLCSIVPMYREKDVFALEDAPLHCLPKVMAEAGYRTIISSASDEPEFERSDAFFRQIGFAETHWEDPSERGRDPRVWGAGLEDDEFYRRFFAMLDARTDAPLFAVAINASNHYPFDAGARREQPGFPTKYGRRYVGSLEAADAWLATFFAELEKRPALRDAIVILVGDHSFPADEHGVHFNGMGAQEESFRTGFALLWPGHVAPERDTTQTASQLDIAPTITDLAGLRYVSQFQGRSLFRGDGVRPPAPMVQPYDGVRLVAVRWPYKLERHESAQQEHLYDLRADPDESSDRIDDPLLASELAALRAGVGKIRTTQSIALERRIWPRGLP